MLYETLSHPKLLLVFILCGVFSGVIFDIGNFIKFLFANKKIPSMVLDFIQTSIVLCLLYLFNLNFNFGQIRFFPFAIFITIFFIYRITIGKTIAKFYLLCYNLLTKLFKRLRKNGKTNKVS